jgi:hypothetical protein
MPLPVQSIPAIAKAASGAIVTIITADNDKPIARGTGFLVRPDGVIVTNYHVIETGNVAIVKFPDGTILPVDGVLAADKVRDLAIIKIHGKTFRTLTLGNSDKIQVGEDVVAIGNPLGLELTVSNGILSGVRTVEKGGGKFLQVTAPISHGSSGGPLFNMAGEVVGITSMYFEGGENLNFAIPVNDAKQLLLNESTTLHNLPNEAEPKEMQSPSASISSSHKREIEIYVKYRGGNPDVSSEIREYLEQDGVGKWDVTAHNERPKVLVEVYRIGEGFHHWGWNVEHLLPSDGKTSSRISDVVILDSGWESSLLDCIKEVKKVLDKYRSD